MRRRHLQDDAADGPDVGPPPELVLLEHLGRHEVGRAAHRELHVRRERAVGAEAVRRAKVRELRDAALVDEDVAALDVAVDDVRGVEVLEATQHVDRVAAHDGLA